jgi:hypothetical protein
MIAFNESEIEVFSLNELQQQHYSYMPGPSIAPDAIPTESFLFGLRSWLDIIHQVGYGLVRASPQVLSE